MGKKLLFLLAVLLIATLETTNMAVRGDLVCKSSELKCVFKCYTGSGKCMRCCQDHGYVHGRCNLILDDFCFCCKNITDPPAAIAGYHGRQPQIGALAPPPHFLNA
ncbi:hypothetical protein ACQ4PT_052207 [Festuca glaucescens]